MQYKALYKQYDDIIKFFEKGTSIFLTVSMSDILLCKFSFFMFFFLYDVLSQNQVNFCYSCEKTNLLAKMISTVFNKIK